MNKVLLTSVVVIIILLLSLACSLPGLGKTEPDARIETISPTATNTSKSPIASSNQCEGLSGQLEVFVMAGPGEAVGLEPFALGSFPIAVQQQDGVYQVSGGGPSKYYEVITKEWGTYEVTMDLEIAISGTCNPSGDPANLDLTVTMSGSQNVIVESPGLSSEYPWNGTASINPQLPVIEGAIAIGDGWKCILHPNS